MALVLNDRVKETTTTTGTGTINLAGAETGFETFVQGVGNSNTTYYAIVHTSANEFEVGLGTVTDASPDTLSRTTIISSTNSDSAVDFSAGTKNVFCTLPASKAVILDGSGNVLIGSTTSIASNIGLQVTGTDAAGFVSLFRDDSSIVADDDLGGILFYGDDNSATTQFASIRATAEGTHADSDNPTGLRFLTTSDGAELSAERLRITNDGKLGVGTTSPAVMLDVRGEVAVDYNATYGLRFYNQSRNNWSSIGNSSTSNDAYMVFKVGLGEALKLEHSKNAVFSGDTITVGDSHTFGNGAGDNLHIESSSGENIVINSAGGIIVLQGGGTERFRLDSSGNMSATGNITAYGSVSDERLKENIEVIENPIEKIKNLKGVTFTYKKDGQKSTGLIAQDLEKVLPEAVYKTLDIDLNGDSEDEHLAIRYGNTVGLLVEAIKELEARVKELEDK